MIAAVHQTLNCTTEIVQGVLGAALYELGRRPRRIDAESVASTFA